MNRAQHGVELSTSFSLLKTFSALAPRLISSTTNNNQSSIHTTSGDTLHINKWHRQTFKHTSGTLSKTKCARRRRVEVCAAFVTFVWSLTVSRIGTWSVQGRRMVSDRGWFCVVLILTELLNIPVFWLLPFFYMFFFIVIFLIIVFVLVCVTFLGLIVLVLIICSKYVSILSTETNARETSKLTVITQTDASGCCTSCVSFFAFGFLLLFPLRIVFTRTRINKGLTVNVLVCNRVRNAWQPT